MSKPPVGLGSHLDTQPTGGKFDGVLGTLAALEVVRTLNDAGIETETPICIVNWTNEEGSRFAPATMASAAYAGDYTTDDILSRKDAAGVTVGEALDGIGYRGASRWARRSSAPSSNCTSNRARCWKPRTRPSAWSIAARASSGTTARSPASKAMPAPTPMPLRRDALAALVGNRAGGGAHREEARPERGRHRRRSRDRRPSRNVIPGEIAFTVDVPQRRRRDAGRASTGTCAPRSPRSPARRKVAIALDRDLAQAADHFDPKLVDAVENAAKALGYSHRRITSGAGHDACNLATVMPAAMVFVPCKDGVSHNELEDATQADCTAGANVLMHTVLALAGVAS